jgi:tRNA threonylcarbamoyladenosine biosynthesis protein TsaB
MLTLALDTTTRAGSLALVRDADVLESFVGDEGRTHATRLPADILDCLARHHLTAADVDLYGVAAGPGSFTGLRIGIATIQGLAFAHGRPVVGVSALEALALAAGIAGAETNTTRRAAWMDAQRGEVYACLYRDAGGQWVETAPPVVRKPEAVLAEWADSLAGGAVGFVGDGTLVYSDLIERNCGGQAHIIRPVPPLAASIARLARKAADAGHGVHPHAIRPVYIRRPDAELARDRRAGLAS